MATSEKLRRQKLRRATLPTSDFAREDKLLQEADRVQRSVEAFLRQEQQLENDRRALAADLTAVLGALLTAKSVIGAKLQRSTRAAGAVNAYAKAGRSGRA